MPLAAGTTVGPYEVISLVGAGGMGEVYRARDPRVNRDVAIKTSASQFSERFEREARAVAALNHPNICTLYDVGPDYLVMEYVEGDDLKGPLPLDEALRVARQIADALDAAHAKGVIHRDLKPGNIKITPDGAVKVLDFGLAKIDDADDRRAGASAPALSQSPTMTIAATQAGIILGTAAYMSPEQARGKAVDKRTDIWAFGVVLYELITGETLFHGEDVGDTLAAVIRKEPDWTHVPPEVRRLLKACLEKDPKNRLRDIGDVWRLLDQAKTESAKRSDTLLPWLAAAVAVAGAASLGFIHFREVPPERIAVRFQVPVPEKRTQADFVPSLSPDGRHVVFAVRTGSGQATQLWIRDVDALESRPIPGTEGVSSSTSFWSPDSRFLAFLAGVPAVLKKIDVSGAPPVTLGSYGSTAGGTWRRDGTILLGSSRGVLQISSGGGTGTLVTKAAAGEIAHAFPEFLPDETHFIYLAAKSQAGSETSTAYVGSLREEMKEPLIQSASRVVYAPSTLRSEPGHLLYLRGSTLMAQPFDTDRFKPVGDALPIAQDISSEFGGILGFFSASSNGAVSYRTGASTGGLELAWFDRSGRALATLGEPADYVDVSISRDGKRVATAKQDAQSIGPDIWVLDAVQGAPNRITTAAGVDASPVWSPDGQQLAYSSDYGSTYGNLSGYIKNLSGVAQDQLVTKLARMQDWSRDGQYLLYQSRNRDRPVEMWYVPLAGERKPVPLPRHGGNEAQGQFAPSPEGGAPRWIAYTSNVSGDNEVYVESFPSGANSMRISTSGGFGPRWRSDGKELFYLSRDNSMMAVDVKTGASFEHDVPHELFKTRVRGGGPLAYGAHFDVSPDGQRFLIITRPSVEETTSQGITVVLNWLAGVKK